MPKVQASVGAWWIEAGLVMKGSPVFINKQLGKSPLRVVRCLDVARTWDLVVCMRSHWYGFKRVHKC